MTLIGKLSDYLEQKSYVLDINSQKLLLIHENTDYYLIENKCGHFGVPLDDAEIKDKEIICSQHGISFSLESGLVVNRPYENCEAIKIYNLTIEENTLYTSDF